MEYNHIMKQHLFPQGSLSLTWNFYIRKSLFWRFLHLIPWWAIWNLFCNRCQWPIPSPLVLIRELWQPPALLCQKCRSLNCEDFMGGTWMLHFVLWSDYKCAFPWQGLAAARGWGPKSMNGEIFWCVTRPRSADILSTAISRTPRKDVPVLVTVVDSTGWHHNSSRINWWAICSNSLIWVMVDRICHQGNHPLRWLFHPIVSPRPPGWYISPCNRTCSHWLGCEGSELVAFS